MEPGVSNYRLFTVQDDVLLKDLDMQGGKIAGNGGAILASTATNLIIQNCTLQNSKANNGGALYFSAGNLIVENSVFTNDSANTGAAIYNVGEAKIYGSYFHHNVMNHNNGGAVANYALNGQKLTVEKSTFAFNKNHSTTNGGAGVFQNAANTECIISNSTFYNNVSQIAPVWIGLSKGTVVNSTIVGNVGTSTSNGYGTGLFLRNDATTTAVVVNNIIAYNWKKSTAEYIDIYAGTSVVKSGTNNILGMNFGSIAAFANSQSVNYAAGENRLFAKYTTIDVDGTSVKIPAFDETTLTVQLGSRSNAIGAGVSTYGTPNIVPQYDQLDSLRAIPQCLGSREEKKAEGGNIHKPLEASSPVIWGNGYGENSFSRFPASYESSIKAIPANGDAIWTRTNLSAGLQIRFRTNADTIRVRYSIESAYTGNQWYASMGSDGIDLYARKGTDMYWCNPSEIAIANEFVYGNLTPDDASYSSNGYEYCLYLPSFVKTTALEIEVDEDADFEYVEANPVKKPIVFYGTSIINGAASSRAGNNYTNIISRSIYDRNIVNLGFSGSGRMEKPVIAAINDIDADIYVLDCLPNMGGTYISTIQNLYIAAVDSIKKYHPTAAIILTEHPGYASMDVYQTHYTTVTDENTELQAAKAVIDSRGYGGIYYISMEDLGMDRTADFSDYIHPNDKGMNVYAAKYLQIIKSILGE